MSPAERFISGSAQKMCDKTSVDVQNILACSASQFVAPVIHSYPIVTLVGEPFMDRRQFLQTLNAIGASTVLPVSALSEEGPLAKTPKATPLFIEPTTAIEVANRAWGIPQIGIVAVGGMSSAMLTDLTWSLPYLNRSIAIDANSISMHFVKADRKILVGGGKSLPINSRAAWLLSKSAIPAIADAVTGLDLVLLISDLGGSTSAGIMPIVAQVLREQNILTLCCAALPFDHERRRSKQIAQISLRELELRVNSLVPVSNSDIQQAIGKHAPLLSVAYQAALGFIQLCRSITNSVCRPGLVNIDFEDLRNHILNQEGHCAFGFGSASGVNGAAAATRQAIDHPLLGQRRLQRASAVLVAIESRPQSLLLSEVKNVMTSVRTLLSPQADFFYSSHTQSVGDNRLESSDFTVSILASGIRDGRNDTDRAVLVDPVHDQQRWLERAG